LRAVARVAYEGAPLVALGEPGALEQVEPRDLAHAADARYLDLELPVAHGAAERPPLAVRSAPRERPEQSAQRLLDVVAHLLGSEALAHADPDREPQRDVLAADHVQLGRERHARREVGVH